MSETDAIWYLRDEGGEPRGPHTADEILQLCRKGQLDRATLCRQEGSTDWHPLADVEPFREVVAAKSETAKKVADAAKRGLEEVGKAVSKAVSTAKKKAKTTSLRLSVKQHERHKRKILYEVGKLLYESDSEVLSQSPYAEKVQLAKAEEKAIEELREQIDALKRPQQAQDEKASQPGRADQ